MPVFLPISPQIYSDTSYLPYDVKSSSSRLTEIPLHDNTFHNILQSQKSQSKTVLSLMSLQTAWLTQKDI